MGGEGYNCPVCLDLANPIRATMSIGKVHYMDSRYIMTCDKCGLSISTNKWRELTAAYHYKNDQRRASKTAEEK